MGETQRFLTDFQTGLGRTEESLGRSLGFLEDFRGQAGEAQRRLEGVEPGLSRTESLLAESAQRQRDAARGVSLGDLDIDRYRSDYMTAVADPALADVERQLQMDLRKLGAQEAQYGQGRGSRGAILEAELRGAAGRSRADIISQVGKEAYQEALDTAQRQQAAQYGADVADIDRQSRAAAALAGLGQAEQAAAIGGRGAVASMYGDVAGRSLAGAGQAGDITRQLAGITGQRLAGVSQADALTSQLAGLAGQQLGAAGQATGISGQALDVARAGGAVPGMYSDIAGQFGDLGESAFGRRRTELETLGGVGRERRGLEQQRTLADMAKFREEDPFGFTQKYLQTIYAAPTQETTRTQDPSTFQEAMGIASLFKEGGHVNRNMGSSIAEMAGMSEADFDAIDADINEADKQNAKMEIKDKLSKMGEKAGGLADAMAPTNLGKTSTLNSQQQLAAMAALSQMTGLQAGGGIAALATGRSVNEIKKDLEGFAPKISRGLTDKEQKTFNVLRDELKQVNQKSVAASVPKPMPRPTPPSPTPLQRVREDMGSMPAATQPAPPPNAFDRVMSGVGSGLRSIGSGIQAAHGFYKEKLDPFRDYSDEERRRIGMSILGTTPQLGETGLTTVFRGAVPAIAAEEERRAAASELARKRAADALETQVEPFEENPTVYNQILKHAATKLDFIFDDDSGEFKTSSGDSLTKAQADELAEAVAGGYKQYTETGKLLPALEYININY